MYRSYKSYMDLRFLLAREIVLSAFVIIFVIIIEQIYTILFTVIFAPVRFTLSPDVL